MSDTTRVYIAVQSADRQLVVDGPLDLWRELLDSLTRTPAERDAGAKEDRAPRDRRQAEARR